MKKTLCPISIHIDEAEARDSCLSFAVTFRNGFETHSLEGMGWQWKLEVDGLVLRAGKVKAFPPVAPGGGGSLQAMPLGGEAATTHAKGASRTSARERIKSERLGAEFYQEFIYVELVDQKGEKGQGARETQGVTTCQGRGTGQFGLVDQLVEEEGVLTVSVLLMRDETWAESGYEVVFAQHQVAGQQVAAMSGLRGVMVVGEEFEGSGADGRGCLGEEALAMGEKKVEIEEIRVNGTEGDEDRCKDGEDGLTVGNDVGEGGLRVEEGNDRLVVTGPTGLQVVWGRKSGELVSYSWGDMQLIGESASGGVGSSDKEAGKRGHRQTDKDCDEYEGGPRSRGMRQVRSNK